MIGIKKIGILGLLMFTFGTNICQGQAVTFTPTTIMLSKQEMIHNSEKTGVYAKYVSVNEGYIEVKIVNNSADSIYLFSSYFDGNLYKSKFLHRYNKYGQSTLSFLPLPFYMAFNRSDKVILTEQAVVNQFQIPYKFEKIEPFNAMSIFLPIDCFNSDYVKDYDPQTMRKMVRPTFEPIQYWDGCKYRQVAFAIYKSINWLTSNNFYYNEHFFDLKSKDYDVLLVNIIQ